MYLQTPINSGVRTDSLSIESRSSLPPPADSSLEDVHVKELTVDLNPVYRATRPRGSESGTIIQDELGDAVKEVYRTPIERWDAARGLSELPPVKPLIKCKALPLCGERARRTCNLSFVDCNLAAVNAVRQAL